MIRGLIETSLIDWDGKITTVLFFDRCNFKCPFCQNWQLILYPENLPIYDFEEIFKKIKERKDWVDGIVLTGGEPLLFFDEVLKISKRIKDIGLGVKLDTNGFWSEKLNFLIEKQLVDYIAMDIKTAFDDSYFVATGTDLRSTPELLDRIRESIKLLLEEKVDYEFRTTCVPGLVDENEIVAIGKMISSAKSWVLQRFISVNAYKEEYRRKEYSDEKLKNLLETARRFVPNAKLRPGVRS